MSSVPVDAKRQHLRFCRQEPPFQPIQTGRFSVSTIGTLTNFPQLVDVCVGLQYLHARDIVHCDLKGVCCCPFPSSFEGTLTPYLSLQDNVLIDSDCRARLADFGLANFDRSRWLGVTSTSSDQGGTRFYMAPELFRCESGGTRSKGPLMRKEADIYALGMLIYEV